MPYIKVIDPKHATGRLADIYQRVSGPGGQVDNVLQIHSLRPHTLEGHMALYKSVLHHPRNKLPKWFLEALGVLVSLLNDCSYCARHHSAGMKRLLKGRDGLFGQYLQQLESDDPGAPFTPREQAALRLTAARENLTAAQAALSRLQAGATSSEQLAANSNVATAANQRDAAQAQLDLLLEGARAEEFAIAEANIASAETAVSEAEGRVAGSSVRQTIRAMMKIDPAAPGGYQVVSWQDRYY